MYEYITLSAHQLLSTVLGCRASVVCWACEKTNRLKLLYVDKKKKVDQISLLLLFNPYLYSAAATLLKLGSLLHSVLSSQLNAWSKDEGGERLTATHRVEQRGGFILH